MIGSMKVNVRYAIILNLKTISWVISEILSLSLEFRPNI